MTTTAPDAPVRAGARPGWVEAVVMFGIAAVVVSFAVWLGARGPIVYPETHDLAGYPGSGIFGGWFRYDGGWYRMIATRGYAFAGPDAQSSVAFFPAYPTVLWALHAVTGLSVKLLGTLVTIVCGLGVVVLFRRWCDDRVDPTVARVATITLVYPYAFFLMGAVYADALFLLAALSAFVLLERGHPLLAGVAGAVATAGRPVGLAVVVGLVAVTLWRRGTISRREGRIRIDLHTLRPADAGVLISLSGIIAWMTYLGVRFGHPLAFQEVQQAPGWDQGSGPRTWFKVVWFQQIKNLPGTFREWWSTSETTQFTKWLYAAGIVVQGLLVLLFLWLAWKAWRRFGWGYGLYSFALLSIPILGSKDFQGVGRYLLPAFPCFLVLAEMLASRPRLRVAVWGVSGALLLGWAFGFGRGYYVA
jgi:hypothetical protein